MSESIWQTLAVADMAVVVADTQYSAISTGYNTGGADRFEANRAAVVAEVRAAVAKHGKNVSSNAAAVPPEAKVKCLWLILKSLQPAIPTLALTQDQKDNIKAAEDWLKDVKENVEVAASVTTPSDPVDGGSVAQTSPTAAIIGSATRRMRACQQEGLI